MKKLLSIAFLLTFIIAGSANAASLDWSFTLESTDNLSWELYFNGGTEGVSSNGGNLLNFWFMDFQYDTAELEYTGWTPNYSLFGTLNPIGSVGNDPVAGTVTNVNGGALGPGNGYQSAPNEKLLLGTFSFTQVASNNDGNPDLNFWMDSGDFGIRIDEAGHSGLPAMGYDPLIYNEFSEGYSQIIPEAAAVPVPAAVWLLGSGLIGLAGLRRRD